MIPFTTSNVAETSVSEINADATVKTGGGGNRMSFAGIVICQKGEPFEVLRITKSNVLAALGKPYHSSKGPLADNMRSLKEALNGGEGVIVRVVPKTAKYPLIKIKSLQSRSLPLPAKESKSLSPFGNQVENMALPYASSPEIVNGDALIIYIVDGDPSANRKLGIKVADPAAYGKGKYAFTLFQEDLSGNLVTLEEHIVSLDAEAMSDMGSSAYIETVLESNSVRLRAIVGDSTGGISANIGTLAFTGGTNGELSDIKTEDMTKAVSILSSAIERYTAVVGLSIYDANIIKSLIAICNGRRIGGFFDLDPRLNYSDALKAMTDLSISEIRALFTHFPYTSEDPTFKNRVIYGISGIHFTAKAKGVAKTSPIGGWHYTPAGTERAMISRTALRLAKGVGEPNYESMYTKRINKIGISSSGNLFIDDSLTSSIQENHLRFEQITSVIDSIARAFVALSEKIKHSPDGITYEVLINGMKDLLDDYVSIRALVPPRDPEKDGKSPYVFSVEQAESDLWETQWSVCVTGSGRRHSGKPIVLG